MLKKVFIALFFFVFSFGCQKSTLEFNPIFNTSDGTVTNVQTFGGTKNDGGQAIIATSDGGFAVLGYTQSMDGDVHTKYNESFDFWLLKFDENASLIWSKTYGGLGDDRGRDLIQTQDGGFAMLGYNDDASGDVTINHGLRDFWLVKTDATGNLLWQKSYGFAGTDEGTRLIETSDKHLLITGVLDVTGSGGQGNSGRKTTRHAGGDYWAVKVSRDGTTIWSRYYGGSFTETPTGLIEDPSGNFLFVGSSDSNDVDITNNKGSYDFWMVYSDANGTMLRQQSFGGSQVDEARGIIATNDGNYILTGDTRSNDNDVTTNNGGADVWLVKTSSTGEPMWNRSFGGSSFDVPRGINKTREGSFIIAGSTRSTDGDVVANKGLNDVWVLKISNDGQLLWQTTIGGTGIDFAYDVVELKNGTIIAVGETNSSNGDITQNKGFSDLLIVQLN